MPVFGIKHPHAARLFVVLGALCLASMAPLPVSGADLPSVQRLLKSYPPVGLGLAVPELNALLDKVTQARKSLPQNSGPVDRARLDVLEGRLRLELDAANAEGRQLARALSAFVSATDALDPKIHADDWAEAQLGLARTQMAMAERDQSRDRAVDAITSAEALLKRTEVSAQRQYHIQAHLLIGEVGANLVTANKYASESEHIPYLAAKSMRGFSDAERLIKEENRGPLTDDHRLQWAATIAVLLNWDADWAVDYPTPLTLARKQELVDKALTLLDVPILGNLQRETVRQNTRTMVLRHAALVRSDGRAAAEAVGIVKAALAAQPESATNSYYLVLRQQLAMVLTVQAQIQSDAALAREAITHYRWLLSDSVWGVNTSRETLLKYQLAGALVVQGQSAKDGTVLFEAIQMLAGLPLIRVINGWSRKDYVHPEKLRNLLRDAISALKSIDPAAAGRVSPDAIALVVEPPPELRWTQLNTTLERFLPGVRKGEPDAVDAFIQIRRQMVPMRLEMAAPRGGGMSP